MGRGQGGGVSLRFFASWFLLTVPFVLSAQDAAVASKKREVIILANSADVESLALAAHYASRRGLAESSIVALPMPLTEQITWGEFVTTIWNPLLRKAVASGAVDAIAMSTTDGLGRTKIIASGHRLAAIVICRGVPLRVAHDALLYDETSNPLTANPSLRTTEAAVDSELTLLAVNGSSIAAFVPNPVNTTDERAAKEALRNVIPVGRLDGPTLDHAKALVDNALIAERDGVAGRAYVDIGGPYKHGDAWLEACVPDLVALGFETDLDKAKATLPATVRFDAPVFYFGWYSGNMDGPFAEPGFRFRPGAVALHIHSFSAATLRSPTRGWTGPLVARGVTATFGNVGEPYLEFTHKPDMLLKAMMRGDPMGVAALRSIVGLSWKGILVGDPLYRPFAVSAEEQWSRRESLPLETASYASIRRMRLLAAAGQGAEALAAGMAGMRKNPSLPLALTLAAMQQSTGDEAAARRTLGVFALLKTWRAQDLALVREAARALQATGATADGVKLLERILADGNISKELRLATLKQGAEMARAAMDFTRSGKWDAEYERLTAPPPAATPAVVDAKTGKAAVVEPTSVKLGK